MAEGSSLSNLTTWLVAIHVLSAINLLGPTAAFGILGSRASKPETGGHKNLEALIAIQNRLVWPGVVVQLVTGVWLITRLGLDENFFSHGWLWVSILAFLVIIVLSALIDGPAIHRIVRSANGGKAPDPKDLKIAKGLGPFFGILFLTIGFLMVTKPF